uniref:Putative ovule protein n=1 Tax=Solanum chacoense TaxID=4108 RepID=A0A0V0GJ22_SOLCH
MLLIFVVCLIKGALDCNNDALPTTSQAYQTLSLVLSSFFLFYCVHSLIHLADKACCLFYDTIHCLLVKNHILNLFTACKLVLGS